MLLQRSTMLYVYLKIWFNYSIANFQNYSINLHKFHRFFILTKAVKVCEFVSNIVWTQFTTCFVCTISAKIKLPIEPENLLGLFIDSRFWCTNYNLTFWSKLPTNIIPNQAPFSGLDCDTRPQSQSGLPPVSPNPPQKKNHNIFYYSTNHTKLLEIAWQSQVQTGQPNNCETLVYIQENNYKNSAINE